MKPVQTVEYTRQNVQPKWMSKRLYKSKRTTKMSPLPEKSCVLQFMLQTNHESVIRFGSNHPLKFLAEACICNGSDNDTCAVTTSLHQNQKVSKKYCTTKVISVCFENIT